MFRNKIITVILLTAVLWSNKAYCQEEMNDRQISTIVGKVIKIDPDSSVISVETGFVVKQAFSDAHLNAYPLWEELIKNGYIDSNGIIQADFYTLDKFSNMLLPKEFNSKKKLIFNIFQEALTDNGRTMAFYITINSDIFQGTHHIASIEIEQGDPVTIQYDRSSPDKNTVIRLVDNKSNDQ